MACSNQHESLLATIPLVPLATIEAVAEIAEIVVLGDPRLRADNALIVDLQCDRFQRQKLQLHKALHDFRVANKFGRSIAAPQIGVNLRLLAVNLGTGYFTMINPRILSRSADTFTLWDDCLSLPQLLVKKRRSCSISLEFTDDSGQQHVWEDCPRDISELLQHEIDHLEGVLATDEPEGPLREAFVFREAFDRYPELFCKQVDYSIAPTL